MLTPAGLVPFTTIDFPNRLAGVIFFQGCPLRCPFCHNPNLQSFSEKSSISWEEVISFFQNRKKQLDGIVLSGGEPLMQPDLALALTTLREMGFQTALHTSGVYPEKLKEVLPLLDWVGLDIKAPWGKYELLTNRSHMDQKAKQSLQMVIHSQIEYEVRTTLDPRYLSIEDVYTLADELHQEGVQNYTLQKYRTYDEDKNPPSQLEIDSFFESKPLLDYLNKRFPFFLCR